jgi:uncharacterized repeat protein (TIGR01451 family)
LKTGTWNDDGDGLAEAGETITYAFSVENKGNVTLYDVDVADLVGGVTVVGGPTTLDVGETDTTTFTGSYVLTQADIDNGSFTNVARATGKDQQGDPAQDDDDDQQLLPQKPAIELLKTGTWNDDGDGLAEAGETITYAFSVENKGNVTLYDVDVADLVGGVTVVGGPTTLDVGETDTTTFTGSYVLTQADIDNGSFTNVARATGKDQQGDPAQDDDDDQQLLPQKPAIELLKTGTWNDDGDGLAEAGETITYAFSVENKGNVTLYDVDVADLVGGVTVVGGPTTLDVGETDTTTFTGSYVLTQADIDNGSFTNVARATGKDQQGDPAQDDDDDQQLLPQKPAIELIKRNTGVDDLDGNGQDEGDQIFYSYSVQNTGNVSLFNVSATDNQLGPITLSGLTDLDADGSADDLAVGATASGSLTATLTQAQINAGSVTNIASTVGTPPTGPDVTDSDTNTVTFDARGSIGDLAACRT